MPDSSQSVSRPRVSVLIPSFHSQDTLARCLEGMLAQEDPAPEDGAAGYEVVVVDSSPDEASAEVVRRYAEVRLVRSPARLLPHAARNAGVSVACGDLLVFTDPDIYPPPRWLPTLVAAHDSTGRPVVGALDCHGRRWLDLGVHLCKFSKWLPGGAARPLDMMPTANLLVSRAHYQAVGGFDGDQMQGDVTFSWDLLDRGARPWFEPAASVDHHHLTGFRDFLRERHRRGAEYAAMRAEREGQGRLRSLLFLLASVLPVRLARIALLVAGHCRRAGRTGDLLRTLPVWLAGHAAWLLGESRSHLRRAFGRVPARSADGNGGDRAGGEGAGTVSSSGGGAVPAACSPARPEMTVIVVAADLRQRAGACLRSLLDQGLGDRLEILLLDQGRPGSDPVPGSEAPQVRVLAQPADAVFSAMRVAGVEAARAPVVAFLEEHVRVRPGWAEAILAAFRQGWDGVGAAVVVANPGRGQADGVGLISYGLWFPPLEAGEAAILPGHNACYRTQVLRDLGDDLEPLLHADIALQQRLHREGRRLYLEPAAVIEHLSEGSYSQLARGMHLWYRCYGPLRAREDGWSLLRRLVYVAAVPIIPLYFLVGFARHLRRRRSPHLRQLLRDAGPIYRVQLWGATGQALGLLFGEGDAAARFTHYELHEPRPE